MRKAMFKTAQVVLAVSILLCITGCQKENKRIILATTTSTENSGLLAYLFPKFEEKTGYKIDVIAVGTGMAITKAKNGDADVVMVHALELENEFVAQGFGVKRHPLMYNDFIVVGPANDPAGVASCKSAEEAFKQIFQKNSLFISRGDNSGTHIKEKELWNSATVTPDKKSAPMYKNYIEAGGGMNEILNIAHNRQGYTLTDRATFASAKNRLDLVILFQGGDSLANPYGIIAVSKKKFPHVNAKGAEKLIQYLLSEEGQKEIASFKVDGEQLFFLYK